MTEENDYGYSQRRAEAVSLSTARLKDSIRNTYKTEMDHNGSMSLYARARINAFKNELRDRGELPDRPETSIFLEDNWKYNTASSLFFSIEAFHICRLDNTHGREIFAERYNAQVSILTHVVRGGFIQDILDIVAKMCEDRSIEPWGRYKVWRDNASNS